MQLVPILSTIILVGTVATFILAVAAYILYKIRERKTRSAPANRAPTGAHTLVTAQPADNVITGQPTPAQIFNAPRPSMGTTSSGGTKIDATPSIFWEYTDEGFVPVSPTPSTPNRGDEDNSFAWL